ncbi:MAG TPA: hypothetical protein VMW80_11440 [Candidatus Dormibacteraeota bacterium]|nr:hypothetical protein [Candidatus Dormibacteraeota bacterium]
MSSTVLIVILVLGALAYLHDGVQAVTRRQQRKQRAAAVYGSSGHHQEVRSER